MTADSGFCSWQGWDSAAATGAALTMLLSKITCLHGDNGARADESAAAYHQRWEEETGNDQLKTHLRGPGKVLRSRLPDLVQQEI